MTDIAKKNRLDIHWFYETLWGFPTRLLLRPFRETDFDDLYEFLSWLEDDEFEGYPGRPPRH